MFKTGLKSIMLIMMAGHFYMAIKYDCFGVVKFLIKKGSQ